MPKVYYTIITIPILFGIAFFSCSVEPGSPMETEIAQIENGLIGSIIMKGEDPMTFNILERMEHYNVPGVSIAVVRNGEVRWAKGYGIANTESGSKVNTETLFQAGSISKPVATLATMKLAQENKVDLDTDVNEYLKDWKVPENKFTVKEKVTLRKLMTHSAGMTVHGFPGYSQTDTFPTITQVLEGNGNTDPIRVDTIPGLIWRYSGGGYTVMEKVVEDVTGQPLEDYINTNFFQPLGMTRSTYNQPLTPEFHDNASAAYNSQGQIIEGLWNNYPEQAAAGLWTTPSDLAKYCIELQQIVGGKNEGVLSVDIVNEMLTKHNNDWGLGPGLQWDGDSLRFQHGGKNAGFTNNMVAFAYRGDAVIVMTNADRGGSLISEIIRSISAYYDLGIMKPRIVGVINLETELLDRLVGTYRYIEEVEDIGDYLVDISVNGNTLVVDDPNNGEIDTLSALEELKFLDLSDGDEVEFQFREDTVGFLWNGRFQFYRVDDGE